MDIDRDEDAIVEECRVCGGSIYIDSDCEEEDIVYCNDCEAEYQILSLNPLASEPPEQQCICFGEQPSPYHHY